MRGGSEKKLNILLKLVSQRSLFYYAEVYCLEQSRNSANCLPKELSNEPTIGGIRATKEVRKQKMATARILNVL